MRAASRIKDGTPELLLLADAEREPHVVADDHDVFAERFVGGHVDVAGRALWTHRARAREAGYPGRIAASGR